MPHVGYKAAKVPVGSPYGRWNMMKWLLRRSIVQEIMMKWHKYVSTCLQNPLACTWLCMVKAVSAGLTGITRISSIRLLLISSLFFLIIHYFRKCKCRALIEWHVLNITLFPEQWQQLLQNHCRLSDISLETNLKCEQILSFSPTSKYWVRFRKEWSRQKSRH